MVHCCILGCRSRSPSEGRQQEILYTFHKFPKSEMRELWIKATGRIEWEPNKYSSICSKHFEIKDIKKVGRFTHLSPDAIPKLFVHPMDDIPSSQAEVPCSSHDLQMKLNEDLESPGKQITDEVKQDGYSHKTHNPNEILKMKATSKERKKKISTLRSHNWRLQKKNSELLTIIENIQSRLTNHNTNTGDLLANKDVLNKNTTSST